MVKEVEHKGKKCFKCTKCGFIYTSRGIAKICEQWCSKYNSCNLDIIKKAVNK